MKDVFRREHDGHADQRADGGEREGEGPGQGARGHGAREEGDGGALHHQGRRGRQAQGAGGPQ